MLFLGYVVQLIALELHLKVCPIMLILILFLSDSTLIRISHQNKEII
jgi:hypothetical protein